MAQHQNVYNQIVLNGFDVCEKPEHPRQHPHGRRRPPDLGEQNEKSDRQTNKMVLLDRHAIPIFLTSYPRVRARVPNARTCIQTDLSCLMQLRSRAFALLRHSSDSTSIQSRLRHSQEPGRRWSKMPAAGDRPGRPPSGRRAERPQGTRSRRRGSARSESGARARAACSPRHSLLSDEPLASKTSEWREAAQGASGARAACSLSGFERRPPGQGPGPRG